MKSGPTAPPVRVLPAMDPSPKNVDASKMAFAIVQIQKAVSARPMIIGIASKPWPKSSLKAFGLYGRGASSVLVE